MFGRDNGRTHGDGNICWSERIMSSPGVINVLIPNTFVQFSLSLNKRQVIVWQQGCGPVSVADRETDELSSNGDIHLYVMMAGLLLSAAAALWQIKEDLVFSLLKASKERNDFIEWGSFSPTFHILAPLWHPEFLCGRKKNRTVVTVFVYTVNPYSSIRMIFSNHLHLTPDLG